MVAERDRKRRLQKRRDLEGPASYVFTMRQRRFYEHCISASLLLESLQLATARGRHRARVFTSLRLELTIRNGGQGGEAKVRRNGAERKWQATVFDFDL